MPKPSTLLPVLPLHPEDAHWCSDLHTLCFSNSYTRPLTLEEVHSLYTSPMIAHYGIADKAWVMLQYLSQERTEADILTLCTHPDARRCGMARQLLHYLMHSGIHALHLEVALTNQAARTLYISLGFRQNGLRKGYYTNTTPAVDACMYVWNKYR